jgi:hypothetical protein
MRDRRNILFPTLPLPQQIRELLQVGDRVQVVRRLLDAAAIAEIRPDRPADYQFKAGLT